MEVGVRPAEGDVGVLKREARRRPKIWPDADCSDPTKQKFVEVTKALVDTTFSCRSGPTPALLSPLPSAIHSLSSSVTSSS